MRRSLPAILATLCACAGGKAPEGQIDATTYTEAWASHLLFQPTQGDPADGPLDTGTPVDQVIEAWVETTGSARTMELRTGPEGATDVVVHTVVFSHKSGLSLTEIDGAPVSPALTLLPASFLDGDSSKSGDLNARIAVLEDVQTWYGVLPEVVEVRIEGSSSLPLPGVIRLAPSVGPVQLDLLDVSGDLAWYAP